MSAERITAIVEKLDKYHKNTPDLIRYLNDAHPIPSYSNDTHTQIDDDERAFLVKDYSRDQELPSVNLLISPSCTGQDSVINSMEHVGCPVEKVKTATTRPKRDIESDNAYVWMEENLDLQEEDMISHLMETYGLIECQRFGNHYYGTPIRSLREAVHNEAGNPVVIKNDQYGASAIRRRTSGEFEVVTIAMLPETYDQLWSRMNSLARDNPLGRLAEAALFMSQFEEVSNYVVINKESEDIEQGVKRTAKSLRDIVQPKGGM